MGETTDEMNRDDRYLANDADPDSERSPERLDEEEISEIRDEIEQTRAQMSHTIDEIQDRLNPEHVQEQVKEQIREHYEDAKEMVREATIGRMEDMVERVGDTVYETRRSIVETIQANPIPAALVGIGLGWMYFNGRGTSRRSFRDEERGYRGRSRYAGRRNVYGRGYSANEYDERRGDPSASYRDRFERDERGVVAQGREAAGEIYDRAQGMVGDLVDQTHEAASAFADRAQYHAGRIEDRFQDALDESPLTVAAVAVALGAAVGLALPQTHVENEWMGEARDSVVEGAQEMAHDTLETVQRTADEAAQRARAGQGQTGQGQRQSAPGHPGSAPIGNPGSV
jgi:hypothetical protein